MVEEQHLGFFRMVHTLVSKQTGYATAREETKDIRCSLAVRSWFDRGIPYSFALHSTELENTFL